MIDPKKLDEEEKAKVLKALTDRANRYDNILGTTGNNRAQRLAQDVFRYFNIDSQEKEYGSHEQKNKRKSKYRSREIFEAVLPLMSDALRVLTKQADFIVIEETESMTPEQARDASEAVEQVFKRQTNFRQFLTQFISCFLITGNAFARVDLVERQKTEEAEGDFSTDEIANFSDRRKVLESKQIGGGKLKVKYQDAPRLKPVYSFVMPDEMLIPPYSETLRQSKGIRNKPRYIGNVIRITRGEMREMFPELRDEINALPTEALDSTRGSSNYDSVLKQALHERETNRGEEENEKRRLRPKRRQSI